MLVRGFVDFLHIVTGHETDHLQTPSHRPKTRTLHRPNEYSNRNYLRQKQQKRTQIWYHCCQNQNRSREQNPEKQDWTERPVTRNLVHLNTGYRCSTISIFPENQKLTLAPERTQKAMFDTRFLNQTTLTKLRHSMLYNIYLPEN